MNLIRHDWRRSTLGIAAGLWCLALAAPALAYDDKSTVSQVMELFGVSSEENVRSIDYSERPKVVIPPGQQRTLPEPRESASKRTDWPSAQIGRGSLTGPKAAAATRENLSEPPASYKQASKDLAGYREPEQASSWNPLNFFSK